MTVEHIVEPTVEDKRIDRHQAYQQFHVGIYVSLATALIGAAFFASDKKLQVPLWPVSLIITFLLLAGVCGGMVLAKLPRAKSYNDFVHERIGFRIPPMKSDWPKLLPDTWESFEHLFFWMAMLIFALFGALVALAPHYVSDAKEWLTISI